MAKDDLPPAQSSGSRKMAVTAWSKAHITGIVGVNLPDERLNSTAGSFEAVEAAARALHSDGHLCVQANGSIGAIPDYPSFVSTITEWYHAAANGNPLLKCTIVLPEVLGYDVRTIASGPTDGSPIRIFGVVNDFHCGLVEKVNTAREQNGVEGYCELEDIGDLNAAPVTSSVTAHGRLRCLAAGPFPEYQEVVTGGALRSPQQC